MTWPRIFHRIWLDEPERPEFERWRERLQDLHPSWEIRTWNKSSDLDWLINQAEFDRYLPIDPFGRVPDIVRYELLYRFGGVYIDTDFEPLRPIDDLLLDGKPWAGWENEATMCTAILASPPNHPAIKLLIDELPDHLRKTENKPPNYASGPEYATARWRSRDDVKRLPPWAFYPVGWWERELLGNPDNYHPDTYAVHHWAKGWGSEEERQARRATDDIKVVILVPYRQDGIERDRNWAYTKAHLEGLGYPIWLGDADGAWNRSEAINNAARGAGEWDVAIIADADTIHQDPKALARAVVQAHQAQSVVVPWKLRWKLSDEATRRVVSRGPRRIVHGARDLDPGDRTPARLPLIHRGGTTVTSRAAWDAIGGFDEAFVGWGHEDVAFRIAAKTLAPGGLEETQGVIYHLWHPRGELNPANDDRKELYKQAEGNARELSMLSRGAL